MIPNTPPPPLLTNLQLSPRHAWAVYDTHKSGIPYFTGRSFTNAPCAAHSVLQQRWYGGFIYHKHYGVFYRTECEFILKIPTQSWNDNKEISDHSKYKEWLNEQSDRKPRPLPDAGTFATLAG